MIQEKFFTLSLHPKNIRMNVRIDDICTKISNEILMDKLTGEKAEQKAF